MSAKVEILNNDITSKVIKQAGSQNASLNNISGLLSRKKIYLIRDSKGAFNPFSPTGVFFQQVWKNETIQETNEQGNQEFYGQTKSLSAEINRSGYFVSLEARELVGNYIDFVVEENDITTHAGFLVNGSFAIGVQTINIDTGTTQIPKGAQITFSDDLIPRYQVQDATGSPTTSIKLDRPLTNALTDNTSIRVSLPVEKTASEAIKDALVSVGLVDRLDSSFDTISASDTLNNYLLTLHIRIEDKIKLGEHVARLLELGDLYLTVNDSGVIGVRRGLAYNSETIKDKLSENELISPISLTFDDSQLVAGYDCLYISNALVKIASGDVDQSYIDAYKNINRWQPIQAKSENTIDYNYLYSNASTADYFGSLRLDYFGVSRINLKCSLKSFIGNNPKNKLSLQLVKDFALTFKIAENVKLVEVPCKVVQYEFNDNEQRYTNVIFQLTNYPLPNITQNIIFNKPEVIEVQPANNGFYAVFKFLNNTLHFEIFLEDKATKVIDSTAKFSQQGDGNFLAEYQNVKIQSGVIYYIRFYLSIDGKVKTEKTDYYKFTGATFGVAQWDNPNAWSVKKWSA